MTDWLKGVVVTFENDIREDSARPLLEAIRQLRGVLSVEPVVQDMAGHLSDERARNFLGQKLLKIVYPKLDTE